MEILKIMGFYLLITILTFLQHRSQRYPEHTLWFRGTSVSGDGPRHSWPTLAASARSAQYFYRMVEDVLYRNEQDERVAEVEQLIEVREQGIKNESTGRRARASLVEKRTRTYQFLDRLEPGREVHEQ